MSGQITLITITNYRSIRESVVVPLLSATGKVIGLYGPNGAGKSNIIKAIEAMRDIIMYSSNAGYMLPYEPFCFTRKRSVPTTFEAEFWCGDYFFRYGFSFTSIRVSHEILSVKSKKTNKYRVLFERSERSIINPAAANYGFGNKLLSRTRQNTLLLTKAYEDNNPFAVAIIEIMQNLLFASFGENNIENKAYAILDKNPKIKSVVGKQLSMLDPSIRDIMTRKNRIPNSILQGISQDDELRRRLITGAPIDAKIVRSYGEGIFLQSISEESIGIRAVISILTLFKYAEYEDKTLFIDEFGNYLHPSLTARMVEMYQHSTACKSLIISSHQLGLYSYVGRSERIIVKKDLATGMTSTEQKRASNNPRRNRDDLIEAEKNFGCGIRLMKGDIDEEKQ